MGRTAVLCTVYLRSADLIIGNQPCYLISSEAACSRIPPRSYFSDLMKGVMRRYFCAHAFACVLTMLAGTAVAPAAAADLYVSAGGNLQAALNGAQPGDTIRLAPGATFVGNFKLPVHVGNQYITIRSAAGDDVLPRSDERISPAFAPYLPVIKSPNTQSALRLAPGAAFWRVMLVEFQANVSGSSNIIDLGDGSSAQSTLAQVPHHLILDRVYVHGDAAIGQKRNIGLNSGLTTIVNSYISDAKAIAQDSQAIGGWNGPGPFRIENNYLEGAGNGILIGGDDPRIPGLTPSGLIFRGNTVTKPLSWRQPIVPAPAGGRATFTLDGTLAAGTYAYRVVARRSIAGNTAKSPTSADIAVTVAAGARIVVSWDPVADAADYLVYGRTPGAQAVYWRVTTTSFTDDGTLAGTAGTPSLAGTVWQVKNLLELKNIDNAQIDHNVMENVWAQAQSGFAILLTPRNQNGGCTWCGVSNVTMEQNVIRHMGAGVQLLGWDDKYPSRQTDTIIIRNNEFSDINKAVWGGDGYFLQVTDGPRNVTIDHNTIISPSGGGVVTVGGASSENFVFTNNVARHNNYGIQGTGKGFGNGAIAFYFPGSVITRNVFAAGKASNYPSGNETPSLADFQDQFADYAAGNFALRPGSSWAGAGTDGLDLGATAQLAVQSPVGVDLPEITTSALPAAVEYDNYAAIVQMCGGTAPMNWSIASGALPQGIALDPLTGGLLGVPSTAGDFAFVVQVTDATGTAALRPLTLHVDRPIPQVDVLTATLAAATATVPYAQALDASGGLGTYTWSVTGGRLPVGLSLSPAGVVAGVTMEQGTASFAVTAFDARDNSRYGSRTLLLAVAPPPNTPPQIALTAPVSGAVVPVGATITLAAQASDADGLVQRVDFFVNGAPIGSAGAPGFTMPWTVPTSGVYALSAVAVDNAGATAASNEVTITTRSEVVIYGTEVIRMAGDYQLTADAYAAGGYGVWNPNRSAAKIAAASANPASFAEFTFVAEAGRPYHLWLRGRAERNDYANDSAFVQFDGVATARIGTTGSLTVNLEDGPTAGVNKYGWQDDGYGIGVLGVPVVFEQTGVQTIRIQPREDGLLIDQIVLSPEKYLTVSPGLLKDDTTILAR
jgi:hypothetical protein